MHNLKHINLEDVITKINFMSALESHSHIDADIYLEKIQSFVILRWAAKSFWLIFSTLLSFKN